MTLLSPAPSLSLPPRKLSPVGITSDLPACGLSRMASSFIRGKPSPSPSGAAGGSLRSSGVPTSVPLAGAACVVGALAPYNHGVPLAGARVGKGAGDNTVMYFGKLNNTDSVEGQIELAYLPPWAPDLNPVEYLWAWLKRHILAMRLSNYCRNSIAELSDCPIFTCRQPFMNKIIWGTAD